MQITIPLGGTAPAVELSPAMMRVYEAALLFGYVDPIRDGRKTGTIVALIRRGLIREAKGRAGRHYLATTPEQVWDEAHTENEHFELEPRFPEGTPEYAAYAAELKTELGKWVAGEAPYGRWTDRLSGEGRQVIRDAAHAEAVREASTPADETPEQRAARHALDKPLIEAFNTITAERADAHSSAYWEAATKGLPREPAFSAPAPTLADDVAALLTQYGTLCAEVAVQRDDRLAVEPFDRANEIRRQILDRIASWRPATEGETPGQCEPEHGPTYPIDLADDVAALRADIEGLWIGTDGIYRAEVMARLDRIAGAVPQRATAPDGRPAWQHACGQVGYGLGEPPWCPSCGGRPGTWRALYIGGAA